jgi:hypothetical protein
MNKTPLTAATLFVIFALAGCAGPAAAPYESPPAAANDPALSAAADEVEPFLRASFADSFAGLVLDHADRTMIVYRRPDPGLDSAARQRAPGVRVEFRDAKYSLRQMQDLAAKIMGDAGSWRAQGIGVNGAGPLPDGAGVEVMTDTGSAADQDAMDDRYGAGAVRVVGGSAQAPIGRTPWRPSPNTVTPGSFLPKSARGQR